MLIVYLESNYTLHQHACIHITINTINTQLMFYLQLYYTGHNSKKLGPLSYEVKVNDNIWKQHVDQMITSSKHTCEPEDNAFDMLPTPESSDTSITDTSNSPPELTVHLDIPKGTDILLFVLTQVHLKEEGV